MKKKERYLLFIGQCCVDKENKNKLINGLDRLNQQDKRIKELKEENKFLKKRNEKLIIDRRDLCLERNDIFEENQQLKQSLEHTNRQLDYFTNRFRGREFKRTGDWAKDIELYMKQLAIKKLEETKNYFDDSSYDKYNESEGWIITNRNVVEYLNNQIKSLKGEK